MKSSDPSAKYILKPLSPFRFKQFEVSHSQSSMRVGVDGVLIGAWGKVVGIRGLDVGTGCGLVALMAAQRNASCRVDAIDIDEASVAEADGNFRRSEWQDRLVTFNADLFDFEPEDRYDFILSNPPFFSSGISRPLTAREKARHQGDMTPEMLMKAISCLLKPDGTFSLIVPFDLFEHYRQAAENHGLTLLKKCTVANSPDKKPKRIMLAFLKAEASVSPTEETLFIRDGLGNYSEAYKTLTRDFYLNF
ncbi:MAG: methyltransferase [Muribaculaceae bacterium]|nr:methyltransferase [Muribaculaceae bacterium]